MYNKRARGGCSSVLIEVFGSRCRRCARAVGSYRRLRICRGRSSSISLNDREGLRIQTRFFLVVELSGTSRGNILTEKGGESTRSWRMNFPANSLIRFIPSGTSRRGRLMHTPRSSPWRRSSRGDPRLNGGKRHEIRRREGGHRRNERDFHGLVCARANVK